jgi:putative flavoprotein involved in K+ transport
VTSSTNTVVVGAGQAGLALSRELSAAGHEHVLLERGRVGQSWRERWESLTLLSPNWLNRLPGGAAHAHPEGFLDRAGFLRYLERYAVEQQAPVVEHCTVRSVEPDGDRYCVRTSRGDWYARNVVVASGDCAVPRIPLRAPAGLASVHAIDYRSPGALPPGAVLVVGAGASGQQLAAELRRDGRDVVLAVGRHSRAPRRYRDRDIFVWLDLLGDLDRTIDEVANVEAARRVPSFPLNGANGGEQLDLNVLRDLGVVVAGRLVGFGEGRAHFGDHLAAEVAKADDRLGKLLARIDDHPAARETEQERVLPIQLPEPPRSLGLRRFAAVLWASGYRRTYPWLRVPGVLDATGEIVQRQGVTPVPGLYVLGLAFQHRLKSHFIGGVGTDAAEVAEVIVARETRARIAA